jgi:hypothetical protein
MLDRDYTLQIRYASMSLRLDRMVRIEIICLQVIEKSIDDHLCCYVMSLKGLTALLFLHCASNIRPRGSGCSTLHCYYHKDLKHV